MKNLKKWIIPILSVILMVSVLVSCTAAPDELSPEEDLANPEHLPASIAPMEDKSKVTLSQSMLGDNKAPSLGTQANKPKVIEADVSIFVDNEIGEIPKELLGIHVPAWNETIYRQDVPNLRLLKLMKQAGIGFLVYPGGNYGYDFVWNDPNLPAEMNTDQFLELGEELGATLKISVNPNQSPQLAADWVDYVNNVKKAGVKYWEIADEPYFTMSAKEFITTVKRFVPLMKEKDPSIKIIANVSASNANFTKAVIREVGEYIDVYSIHFLPLPPSNKISNKSAYSKDAPSFFYEDLLMSSIDFKNQLSNVKKWVREAYPKKEVEYHVGSFTTVYWGPEDWTVNALPAGLWVADMLGTFAEEKIDASAFWALMNPYPPGNGDFGMFSPEMKPYVAYYPYELFSRHFGEVMLKSKSSQFQLTSYASLSYDRKNLYILLINKNPDTDVTASVDIGGFIPRGEGAAWILDGPVIPDHVYDYGLRREKIRDISGNFEWTIPAYSVATIEVPGVESTLPLGETPNLARNKLSTASSIALNTDSKYYTTTDYIPDFAIDGDPTTRWASKIFTKDDEWFEVDLGQIRTFNQITLDWEYWATQYTIEYSQNRKDWMKIADQTNAITVEDLPQPKENIILDSPIDGRYIRLTMTGRPNVAGAKAGTSQWTPQAFSLWEIGVYLK